MTRKSIFILFVFSLIIVTNISSQSNDIIDTFLDRADADLATSIWLVLLSEDLIPEDSGVDDAMSFFGSLEYGEKIDVADAGRAIEFGEFAYIAMETMDLPGGMMYAMFPSPRYASREFLYRRWIPRRPKQKDTLSPWEVTSSISELIAWKEAQK